MRNAFGRGRGLRWLCLLGALMIACSGHAWAQETAAQETGILDAVTRWKIINTAIFLAGLGWLIWKYAPAFFNARSADIQKAIKDATGLKLEADFRYSEVDRKMATLGDQVKRMREESARELEHQHNRLQQETQLEIERIHRNVAAETEAFRREGMYQVRRHTAQLALQSAEQQLQDRFRGSEPEDLLRNFIRLVEQGKN